MPRPKQPAGYPAAYYNLIEMVTEKHEPLSITCESNKKAQLMRFAIYDFIKACRRSPNKREHDLGEMAYGLVFSVKENVLTISIRDMMADAQAIDSALSDYMQGGKPGFPAQHIPQAAVPPAGDAQEDMIARYYVKGDKK